MVVASDGIVTADRDGNQRYFLDTKIYPICTRSGLFGYQSLSNSLKQVSNNLKSGLRQVWGEN